MPKGGSSVSQEAGVLFSRILIDIRYGPFLVALKKENA
jgi:hypothetical protein